MQAGMFDVGSQSMTHSALQPSQLCTKVLSAGTALSSIIQSEFDRSTSLIKVFRHWRLYTRQQLYRRKS